MKSGKLSDNLFLQKLLSKYMMGESERDTRLERELVCSVRRNKIVHLPPVTQTHSEHSRRRERIFWFFG